METRAHHILIGLFTVAVAASGMWFVLWMADGGPGEEAESRLYDIVFRQPVTGLSNGNRVLYNGIPVGQVERIRIDPDDPRQVIARVQVTASTPVREDTRAELILANITGASEIQLLGGSAQSPPLEGGDGGVPRITARASQITRLSEALTEVLDEASRLLENSNRLLSRENTAHLARSLENLERFTSTLAGQSEAMRQGVDDLSRISARIERLLRENEAALADGMQGLNDLGPALDELRRSTAAVRKAVERFDRNPGDYLLRREPVREFQP
ncbi:MAG: MlaD family protein [Pseudomonadota bacterium]|nr:MlaD family protein [Pseudomonadota bacterium]